MLSNAYLSKVSRGAGYTPCPLLGDSLSSTSSLRTVFGN
jgi:hypothetical protein